MERERERAAFASHQNQMFSREAAKTHSENDDDEKKNLSQLPTTGLVGILPKLWEKDLHRIITGWANEFGPVFKLRVMQFHVSREFFQFSVFFFFFFPAKPRRVSPLPLSTYLNLFSLSLSLSLKKKKKQAIVITDPALATHVCRSKLLDKFRFQYHFMDEVRKREREVFVSHFFLPRKSSRNAKKNSDKNTLNLYQPQPPFSSATTKKN